MLSGLNGRRRGIEGQGFVTFVRNPQKKRRETVFGHKLFLTGGVSGLMLDAEVVRGNPNDAGQFQPWMRRQYESVRPLASTGQL